MASLGNPPDIDRRITPRFARLFAELDRQRLDGQHSTIFGLHSDYTIGYLNPHWFRFAVDNDAPEYLTDPGELLGRCVLEQFAGPMRPLYKTVFDRVCSQNEPYQQQYECSSPDVIRLLQMRILPLPPLADSAFGLLLINSRAIGTAPSQRDPPVTSPCLDDYLTDDNLLICCSNCRRFRHCDDPERWDWIPSFLRSAPAPLSHGLCSVCLEYYYPIPNDHPES